MMKNKAMRIAAGAGVTTLLTMSVISGSFAKYITSGTLDRRWYQAAKFE